MSDTINLNKLNKVEAAFANDFTGQAGKSKHGYWAYLDLKFQRPKKLKGKERRLFLNDRMAALAVYLWKNHPDKMKAGEKISLQEKDGEWYWGEAKVTMDNLKEEIIKGQAFIDNLEDEELPDRQLLIIRQTALKAALQREKTVLETTLEQGKVAGDLQDEELLEQTLEVANDILGNMRNNSIFEEAEQFEDWIKRDEGTSFVEEE